jgi:hypothetical protein
VDPLRVVNARNISVRLVSAMGVNAPKATLRTAVAIVSWPLEELDITVLADHFLNA